MCGRHHPERREKREERQREKEEREEREKREKREKRDRDKFVAEKKITKISQGREREQEESKKNNQKQVVPAPQLVRHRCKIFHPTPPRADDDVPEETVQKTHSK